MDVQVGQTVGAAGGDDVVQQVVLEHLVFGLEREQGLRKHVPAKHTKPTSAATQWLARRLDIVHVLLAQMGYNMRENVSQDEAIDDFAK